ncbi:DUF7079 family protein [Paraburkholderia phenazinium]|jgi:hypothetical protein|uniref:DUF7079 domain-containing protein n=1 Tax=Paraburkholderia phenazinium TaxID=60549 RepID=A0A1G7VZ00_9BURK|nr:hypothetical protein SAMN05216466_104322 [Paraburkholderia phenazinium]
MENPVGKAEREFIWAVMSEFFVDNEIDYEREAAQISRFPINFLKEIFFREVAPVCGPNMLTPAPPVWAGFDSDWVISQINSLLSTKEASLISRVSYEASVLYYRLRLADVWGEVEDATKREHAGQAGSS